MTGIHFLDAKGPPGVRLYAIGDVHGRLDLLSHMHEAIVAEIARNKPADWRIIHLGDYIDRGPDSKGVLDFLLRKQREDRRSIVLAGNHDAGLVAFLAQPAKNTLFAGHGGRETACSYGVDADFSSDSLARDAAARLLQAIPQAHLRFLASLPRSFSAGDFFFCHAGIRPGVPLEKQDDEDLIWIRNEFLSFTGLHPKVIVHGHTPDPEPEILANRVNIDTQAYLSDRLTALVIDGAEKRIMAVEGKVSAWR